MSGWIKLHRKLTDWGWYRDSETVHLFIHLLLSANHKRKKWGNIIIERGQLVVGRKELSSQTGISVQSIRTRLKRLISTSEITIKSTNKFSVITLINFELYQDDAYEPNQQNNQETNHQSTSNQPATNQQLTTNKNVRMKECKNEENTNISLKPKNSKTIKQKAEEFRQKLESQWKQDFEIYQEDYPNRDYNLEFLNMIDWIEREPAKASKRKNPNLFIRNWLNRAKQNFYHPPRKKEPEKFDMSKYEVH